MKIKICKLLSNTKQALFALALTLFSGTAYSQTTYTFNYTGSSQSLAVSPGNYEIECWGGNGGDGGTTAVVVGTGGKGGYSKGVYTAVTASTLYIYVGGKGQSVNTTGAGLYPAAGGWNGGGRAYNATGAAAYYKGGGGGGSDVRTTQNTTYANRVIVAGGAGGAAGSNGTIYAGLGGNGGGTSGQDGVLASSQTNHNGKGGTQTAGGAGGAYGTTSFGVAGIFGEGGDGGSTTGNGFAAAGGGGGWYGGGGGAIQGGGGGGGSGYIGGVSSGTTAQPGQTGFVVNPVTTGTGLVLIKELCNISIAASGTMPVNSTSPVICSGQSLTLTTNATSNYLWSTGATTSSLVVNPSTTTTYTLGATASSGCNASSSITVTVNQALPTLTISNSTSGNGNGVCANGTATLTASGATTYTWTGSVTNGVSFIPAATSDYTVTGQNGCGITTAITSVSIHPNPALSAISVANPTMCSGTTNTLTASGSGISTYSWSTSSTASFITVSPSANTNYTVKGTSAFGCTNTAATTVTVFTTPLQVPVASPAVVCLGGTSTLTAVGSNFTWSPGGAGTSSITVTPTGAGVQTFTVIKANGACSDTKTLSITVNALPVITAQALPTVVCASFQTATLSGSGGTSYTWAPAGGTASTAMVTGSANTTYTLTGSDGTCVSTSTVNLGVNPNPTITLSASSSPICANQSATLMVSGGTSYSWNPSTISGSSVIVSPTISTGYSVIGYDNNGCSGNASQIIVVGTQPTLALGTVNSNICAGNSTTLTASGSHTYAWTGGPNTNTYVVTPNQTTAYTVVGTNTSSGCSDTKTININVYSPVITIAGNTTLCAGNSASLSAGTQGGSGYNWEPGSVPFAGVSLSPNATTIYTVSAQSASNSIVCPVSKTVEVIVNTNPTITAQATRTVFCIKESATITVSGANTYSWTNGTNTGNGSTIVVTGSVVSVSSYSISGTSTLGCVASINMPISVSACSGIERLTANNQQLIVYPNPNNGEFMIKGDAEMNLTLVNALGQRIQQIHLDATNNYQVEVSGLSQGIYFIAGENFTRKIITNK